MTLTDTELEKEYQRALAEATRVHDWYRGHRRPFMYCSLAVRGAAVIAIALGVLLPLIKPADNFQLFGIDFAGPSQAAVACIVVAGLAIAADQVFMISATWNRYAMAMLKIDALRKVAEWDWAALRAQIGQAAPSPQQIADALLIFKTLVLSAHKVMESESAVWSVELPKAIDQLRTIANEQRTTAENLAKEERKTQETIEKAAKAVTNGHVRVIVEDPNKRIARDMTVQVGSVIVQKPSFQPQVICANVPIGLQTAALTALDAAGNPVSAENVLVVAGGAISDIKLVV